jgi:DNA-binding Lrp family transcriptional regulator
VPADRPGAATGAGAMSPRRSDGGRIKPPADESADTDDTQTMTQQKPDWSFKRRDIVVLRELARDPQLSARELTDVLEREYDIDVSHVTVSKSIRKMREAGVFRETIIPNEAYFTFALFEFKFNPEHFAEEWRAAMEYIRDHENTLFYFLSDGEYQWKSVMMFTDHDDEARWIHEFYKRHGKVVSNLRNSTMINVLKFATDPELFEHLFEELE